MAALTLLAPLAVLASEMPRAGAWPLALAAVGHGVLLLRREARRPRRIFVFDGGRVRVDGAAVDGGSVSWRGPLAFVQWRDAGGGMQRLAWWPDTLPPACRRELRLAAPGPDAARQAGSVAP